MPIFGIIDNDDSGLFFVLLAGIESRASGDKISYHEIRKRGLIHSAMFYSHPSRLLSLFRDV